MTDSTERPFEAQSESTADDGGHLRDETPQQSATGTATSSDGDSFRRRRDRRGLLVPIVATAVVAALIGGGVGAGVALWANPATTNAAATGSGSGIVINHPSTASAVSAVAAKASPSVVTISVSDTNESGTGSGIVLSSDGYVLTNNHVVTLEGDSSGATVSVTTSGGRVYAAKIVGADPLNDLAVIKLEKASGLTPATFASSDDLNVGDPTIVLGAPLDLPNTVTTGIVSAVDRSIAVQSSAVPDSGSGSGSGSGSDSGGDSGSPFNFWDFGDGSGSTGTPTQTSNIYLSVLQTDAAINPGNSGGALLDSEGDVIGVVVAIAGTGSTSTGQQSGNIGVGFAIPSTIAKRIADEIVAGKTPTHGQLGVNSNPNESASTGTVVGVEVASAPTAGSPAGKVGLKKGDIITAVGRVPVTSYKDLAAQVRSYAGGSKVPVTYSRGGSSKTVTVTLGTADPA